MTETYKKTAAAETAGGFPETGDIRIKELSVETVRQIYRERMVNDFPADELRPLSQIEKAMRCHYYICYGVMDGESLIAYAFLIRDGRTALLDYFVVRHDLRGRGYGTRSLKMLMAGPLRDYDRTFIEIDNPDSAKNEEDLALRNRRLRFYRRCGAIETGLASRLWGVEFRLLLLTDEKKPAEDIGNQYLSLYRIMLPENIFRKYVFLYPGKPEAPSGKS